MKSKSHKGVTAHIAVIAASAVVVIAAVAGALAQQQISSTAARGSMNVGQTVTSTTPPTTIAVASASPVMKAVRPKGFR